MQTIEEKYTIGRFGSKLEIERQVSLLPDFILELKDALYTEFCIKVYTDRPRIKYGNFLICPCGSHYKQIGKDVLCTRKQCYRSKNKLSIETAKVIFIEDLKETTVIEEDVPAGNKAEYSRTGIVRVIKRDNKYV